MQDEEEQKLKILDLKMSIAQRVVIILGSTSAGAAWLFDKLL